jgi:transcriptional pleiotropic regulator of transition state genes
VKKRGVTRAVDELGRVVIPIEVRRDLEIGQGDLLEIIPEGNRIILQPVADRCTFCGDDEDLVFAFKGKPVCRTCWNELQGCGTLPVAKAS